MNKLLLTTALLLAIGAAPAHAVTEVFCGPATEGNGVCESGTELKVFLNEGHNETSGSGNVGSPSGPLLNFTTDGGLLDIAVDTGGGFANITASRGFADFNGVDIKIPGFTFTDIVFDDQLNPTEASGVDSFTAEGFSGFHISDGVATGFDAPETDKQFSLTAVGGAFDEVNLFSADGFKEIKHIEISGLAATPTPELSTWAMVLLGLGLAMWRGKRMIVTPRLAV
jgi:hypothetical protein